MIRLVVMGSDQIVQATCHYDDIVKAQERAKSIIACPIGISRIDLFQCDSIDSPSRRLLETMRPDPATGWIDPILQILTGEKKGLKP